MRWIAFLLLGLIHGLALALVGEARPAQAQEITWLEGHEAPLYSAAYAPDGKTLVSADVDGVLRIWDRATGERIRTIPAHRGAILSLAMSPNGRQFASAGIDREIRIYDLPARAPLAAFTSFAGDPRTLAVSPDGKRVVTGDTGRLLRLWNQETNATLRDFAGSTAAITASALSPDGQYVLAACDDGSLRAWKLSDTAVQATWHGPPLTSLAFHPEGKRLLTGSTDGSLRELAWPAPALRAPIAFGAAVNSVAVAPDGARVVASSADATVRVISAAKGDVLHTLSHPSGPVTSVTISAAKAPLVAAGSQLGVVALFNAQDGKPAGTLVGHEGAVHAMRYLAAGQSLVTAGQDGVIRLWNVPRSWQEVEADAKAIQALAVSPRQAFAATLGADKSLNLWQLPDFKKTAVATKLEQAPTALAVSDDGLWLTLGDTTGALHVFHRPASNKDFATVANLGAHPGGVRGLKFAPGSASLYSVGADGSWKLWQLPQTATAETPPAAAPLKSLAVSSQSARSAAGNDQTLTFFDSTTGKVLHERKDLTEPLATLAFDPAGEVLYRASIGNPATTGHTVQALRASDGAAVSQWSSHQDRVIDLAVSPASGQIATAAADGSIFLWQPARTPIDNSPQKSAIRAIASAADGSAVAVVAADGTLQLYKTEPVQEYFATPRKAAKEQAAPPKKIAPKLAPTKLPVAKALISALAFAPGGKQLLTGDAEGNLQAWDVATAKPSGKPQATGSPITCLAIHAAEPWLATGHADGALRYWKYSEKSGLEATRPAALTEEMTAIEAHTGPVTALAMLPNSPQLVSVGEDHLARLWDNTGKEVRKLDGAAKALRSVVANAAGQIAAGGDDNAIFVWNAADGKQLQKIATPAACQQLVFRSVTSAAAGAPRIDLAASLANGQLLLVDPATGKLQESLAGLAKEGAFAPLAGSNTLALADKDQQLCFTTTALRQVLTGHQGAVNCVTFLPDGQLLSGGADKTVRLWNLADGSVARTFAGSADAVTAVAFAEKPALVVAAGNDKQVRVWNLADAKAVHALPQPAVVRSLSISPDGNRVAVSGDDAISRTFDLTLGKELQYFAGHTGAVPDSAISHDGRWLVTVGADKTLRRFPLAAERMVVAHVGGAHALDVAADGKSLVTVGEDKLAKRWDLEGKLLQTFSSGDTPLAYVSISPAGDQLAAGGDPTRKSAEVLLWKLADTSLIKKLAVGSPVTAISYVDGGKRLGVSAADNKLRFYEAHLTANPLLGESVALPVTSAGIAPHSVANQLLVAGADGKLRVVPLSLQQVLLGHAGAVSALAVSPDDKLLYSAGADKTVRQWELEAGMPKHSFAGSAAAVQALSLSPDGATLVAGGADKIARAWTTADAKPLWELTLPAGIRSLELTAAGERLVTATDDPLVRVFDLKLEPGHPRLIETFPGHTAGLLAVAATADGRAIFSGSTDKALRTHISAVNQAAVAHAGAVRSLAISPSGEQAFSAGEDGHVALWSVEDLKQQQRLPWGKSPATGIAVSGDGQTLAAVNDEGKLQLWEAATGQPGATWQSPQKLRAVALDDNASRILVGDDQGGIVNLHLSDAGKLDVTQQCTGHTAAIVALAFAADGEFYSTALDRTAKRWFAATAPVVQVLSGHERQVFDLAYSANGKQLISASADGTARVWDLATGTESARCEHQGSAVQAVTCRGEGSDFVTAAADGVFRHWDFQGKALSEWQPDENMGTCYAVAWAPNHRYLLAGHTVGLWQVWDKLKVSEPATLIRTGRGHSAAVLDMAHQKAGNRFATVDQSGKLFIWNAADGNLLYHVQLPAPAAYSVAYSPDGKEIAVATSDRRLLLLAIPAFAQ